jgi:hypothetical protein
MKERKTATKMFASSYQQASKKRKMEILDEFIQLTGYDRCYAAFLLRWEGKKVEIEPKRIVLGDARKKSPRQRARTYGEDVISALKKIWVMMDCICGKRLVACLPELIPILERHGEIKLKKQTRSLLLRISAATIDRLLAEERRGVELGGRARTKPGTLLKRQIPIRTFADWNEQEPGFVEIDLVGHEGGLAQGDFIQTLDVVDVHSGWTETRAVKNKAQVWVFEALQLIRQQLPFKLLGIDSDNGSEFINDALLSYCQEQEITFTRSRSGRKNDNCYVEQKNYSVVRRAVGYARYDDQEQLQLLNELYSHLRLYTNFFQPVMKLKEKERIGSKVIKRYDKPQTPYRRLLESSHLSQAEKEKLRSTYGTLNPAELKRQITRLQEELLKSLAKPKAPLKENVGLRKRREKISRLFK